MTKKARLTEEPTQLHEYEVVYGAVYEEQEIWESLRRYRVPGGWVYLHLREHKRGNRIAESMCFVPDPEGGSGGG